ncbi:ATP-dependent helicase [Helcococcus kunzii]|uniref:ATP-dependent helicase n=1 Tax=Helcococcus kunzii TaxID=40091 RepID=UPI001BAF6FB6|nr:ATP-dependent helicase [Helcococcus kunzii]QUY64523.1 ATP-dependent helicase [Helcococcus kunzii]
MKYSNSQLEAINHKEGPALVLAVPGSGKTTVLLARIHNLIKNGVNPNNILAMTFSKSQAIDMEKRYLDIYGTNGVKFSTIHSFAYGIVRSFSYNSHKIQLIESSEQYNKYSVVKQIFYQIRHKMMTDEQLESFFRVSSFLKNTLMDYNDYKKMYSSVFREFEKVYNMYENFKSQRNLIDFDDMLVEALNILQNNIEARRFLQNKFNYIQIDEGQDTSYVQLKIISLVAMPKNNLFIVADDDQSIYGFRGASSKQLLNFPANYPDAKVYYMQDNFRSTKNIARLSNKLIKNNKQRYSKSIKSIKEDGNIIELNAAKNTRLQTEHVIEQAKKHINNNQTVAILYRNNISAINIIEKLDDIDFYIKNGQFAFYSHQIIQDIINIYHFSKDTYDIKLFEKIFYKLNLFIRRDFIEQIKFMNQNEDVIERLKQCEGVNNFFLEKIYLLSYLMDKLSQLDFYDAILYIINHMDYYEYLKEYARRSSSSMISIDRTIDTLINISKDVKTVKEFENKIFLLKERQKNHSNKQQLLTLSTIHGAKGLEFDNVYIIDLVENEFPSMQAESANEELGVLEEERRLFYVGMTRAKQNLSLIYPKKLYTNSVEKSSFIDEII